MKFEGREYRRDELAMLWLPEPERYHRFNQPTNLLVPSVKREHLTEIDAWARTVRVPLANGFRLTVEALEIYKPFEHSPWLGLYPDWTAGISASASTSTFWQPQTSFSVGDLVAAYNRFVPRLEVDDIARWANESRWPVRARNWFAGFAEAARADADKRAHEVLLSHCTEAQKLEWIDTGCITVKGSAGGIYELDLYEVMRMSDEHNFCIQIVGEETPLEDAVLMRKLLLETNEPEFLRIANDLDAEPPPFVGPPIPLDGAAQRLMNAATNDYISTLVTDSIFQPSWPFAR